MKAVVLRAPACDLFEVFAESRLGGKVEAVSDFLNSEVGVREHDACFCDNIFANPVDGPFAAVRLHHSRYVFWCQIHLVGIERQAALTRMVFAQ